MPETTILVPLTEDVLRDKVLTFATAKSHAKAVKKEFLGEMQIPIQTPKPPDFNPNDIDEVMPEATKAAVNDFMVKLVSPHDLKLVAISIEAAPGYETPGLRGWRVFAQVN